jgi:gluconolactonase
VDPALPRRNGDRKILRYELSPDGTASHETVFVDYGADDGADGLKVDGNGNLYACVGPPQAGIHVYAPTGREIAFMPTPGKPSNLTFAQSSGQNWLYVTSGQFLYRIRTLQRAP